MSLEDGQSKWSGEKTQLDKYTEINLKKHFFNDGVNEMEEDYIEDAHQTYASLLVLERAADSLGLVIQSFQRPDNPNEEGYYVVIGRTNATVRNRTQEVWSSLLQIRPLMQTSNFLPLSASQDFTLDVVDPNFPFSIAGKWFLQNDAFADTIYTLKLYSQEIGSVLGQTRRQIFGHFEISDQEVYIRLLNPASSLLNRSLISSSAAKKAIGLIAFSLKAEDQPSALQRDWKFLCRKGNGSEFVNCWGTVCFKGDFGLEMELKIEWVGGGMVLVGEKRADDDGDEEEGTEVNIEAKWASLMSKT